MEELVIRFESGVVEVFYAGRGDSDRFHIAQLERCELLRLDSSRGPTFNLVAQQRGGASLTHIRLRPEQLPELQKVVAEINQAIG